MAQFSGLLLELIWLVLAQSPVWLGIWDDRQAAVATDESINMVCANNMGIKKEMLTSRVVTNGMRKNIFSEMSLLEQFVAKNIVSNHSDWAWRNYKSVVLGLQATFHCESLLEVGAGRSPLLDKQED